MSKGIRPLSAAEKSHPVYLEGRKEGFANNKMRRGLMAFGLSFAANPKSARLTRLWLAGFDSVVEEKKTDECAMYLNATGQKWTSPYARTA